MSIILSSGERDTTNVAAGRQSCFGYRGCFRDWWGIAKSFVAEGAFVEVTDLQDVPGVGRNGWKAKSNAKKEAKAPAAKAQDFDGWVSDEKGGAKIDAECSKKCQAAGAKMVFSKS